MIDIKKLLRGPHLKMRYYKILKFRNMCDYNSCKYINCKGCPNSNYYVGLIPKYNNRYYRLPGFIQVILRRLWD